MKLKFDSNLPYQHQAVKSVVDLFRGQTANQANFSVNVQYNQISGQMGMAGTQATENGIGNKLELIDEDILENLQLIQMKNGLSQTKKLTVCEYDFDVEMETGTGKTYVYLRTIFELNKEYGFTKFIIVVPSIAIKEGVLSSLQITSDHFKGLYDNTIYEYFIYDSSKLDQVRNFAVSDNIQIMIINIDAFRRSFDDIEKISKANIIHRQNDKLNGMKPIELIRETNPFVIIDEPQSVDKTAKAKDAIKSLNPLCKLRYSATHVEKHNLVYKLDALDAYEKELVKQIEVASFESKDYHNNAYMKLVSVDNKKSPITARIEIDCEISGSITRKTVTIKKGDDLSAKKLSDREIYEGYIVNEIYCEVGNEYVDFTSKSDVLRIGKAIGDIDDMQVKEQQIRKTIEEHLNKERVLNKQGIKVLSLFFIDRVANYRFYDENGVAQKGMYAQLFEKHYSDLIKRPKYNDLFKEIDSETPADGVHNGYFSADKKGVLKDTNGETAADDDTYSLIMKEKEKLLSFDSKLRFIFSHSALREGWDNPNVFQICTLNETRSEVKKRQEIGRGLRLCVNQDGERLHGFSINTLTVMANESYEEFANKLQREYEIDQNIRFGVLENHSFANIPVSQEDGATIYLLQEASEQIYNCFEKKNYIDKNGKVLDALRLAVKSGNVEIPEQYESSKSGILEVVKKACGSLNIKPANEKMEVKLNKSVYLSPEFKELWDRIKYKTTYSVDFDSQKLIEECQIEMVKKLDISAAKLVYTKAKTIISVGGVETIETGRAAVTTSNYKEVLPDIITFLQNETNLTRKTIVEILVGSKSLDLFKRNPQKYMEETAKIITSKMRTMIVDGIKYTKLGDDEYYAQELFENNELFGYLSKNMIKSERSVYEYVVYDSSNEEKFAIQFENNNSVKCYAKLPNWFKIPTPLGTYNPDWAVLIEKDDEQKLYFVIETKANLMDDALRPNERMQKDCGKKSFAALGDIVEFKETDDFKKFMEGV